MTSSASQVRRSSDSVPPVRAAPPVRPNALFAALSLVVVTLFAYWPGLSGGFIWDDPDYVVNNRTLRTAGGLVTMWTDIRSLPQWYPLVHTTYWIEFQTFRAMGLGDPAGLWPVGFKFVNLLLHVATALLLWRLLRMLDVPGAYVAAFVFAVHPVHVESVAWITERKNTLSGLFYVAAFIVYLKFAAAGGMGVGSGESGLGLKSVLEPRNPDPDTRSSSDRALWYVTALVLFAGALLSKTVTATFPAAVLVVIWWKRGGLRLSDFSRLAPFFAMGITMGLLTAWLERHHVGAVGPEWDHSPVERLLIAGRAVWFYFATLLYPVNLAFMYEKWTIDAGDWRSWLYPVTAAGVVFTLLLLRGRIGRGPLAAALLFGGTLFPALGFFNVYPHRYAFVADHFQHLASIAITTAIVAGVAVVLRRWPRAARMPIGVGLSTSTLIVLSVLTFRQARVYEDAVTLWLDTAAKSPGNWIAWTQLGRSLADAGQTDAAIAAHRRAFALNPDVPDTCYNMAMVYARAYQTDEAERLLLRTIELSSPRAALHLDAMIKLGMLMEEQRHDPDAAERWYRRATQTGPGYTPAERAYAEFLRRRSGP